MSADYPSQNSWSVSLVRKSRQLAHEVINYLDNQKSGAPCNSEMLEFFLIRSSCEKWLSARRFKQSCPSIIRIAYST